MQKSLITQILPLSSHDGPGMRTTIFFKGCSLRCRWCHNPETISFVQQIEWDSRVCIGCGMCVESCSVSAISLTGSSGVVGIIDRKRCVGCGSCVEVCPSKALQYVAKSYTSKQLIDRVMDGKPLIDSLGGGVTLSGGEATLHPQFIEQVVVELKRKGVHIALDSCGAFNFSHILPLLPYLDLILYDIKDIRGDKHREFTGRDNIQILSNLLELKRYLSEHDMPLKIWIRTPLIPTMTAERENVEGIGEFIFNNLLDVVERWELCAFNNLCGDKYRKLGIDWELGELPLLTLEEMEGFVEIAKLSVKSKILVKGTGLTKSKN